MMVNWKALKDNSGQEPFASLYYPLPIILLFVLLCTSNLYQGTSNNLLPKKVWSVARSQLWSWLHFFWRTWDQCLPNPPPANGFTMFVKKCEDIYNLHMSSATWWRLQTFHQQWPIPLRIWYDLVKVTTKIDVEIDQAHTDFVHLLTNNGTRKAVGKLQQHMPYWFMKSHSTTWLYYNSCAQAWRCLTWNPSRITQGSPPRNTWWRLW